MKLPRCVCCLHSRAALAAGPADGLAVASSARRATRLLRPCYLCAFVLAPLFAGCQEITMSSCQHQQQTMCGGLKGCCAHRYEEALRGTGWGRRRGWFRDALDKCTTVSQAGSAALLCSAAHSLPFAEGDQCPTLYLHHILLSDALANLCAVLPPPLVAVMPTVPKPTACRRRW